MDFSRRYSDLEVLVQPGDIITVQVVDVGCKECNTHVPEATAQVRYTGLYQISAETDKVEIQFDLITSQPLVCSDPTHRADIWLVAPLRGLDIPLAGLNLNRPQGLPYLNYIGSEKPGLN